jgi:hypothetical protein
VVKSTISPNGTHRVNIIDDECVDDHTATSDQRSLSLYMHPTHEIQMLMVTKNNQTVFIQLSQYEMFTLGLEAIKLSYKETSSNLASPRRQDDEI